MLEHPGTTGGNPAGSTQHVFDSDRQAGQSPHGLPGSSPLVDRVGRLHCPRASDAQKGVNRRIVRFDAIQVLTCQLRGREFAVFEPT